LRDSSPTRLTSRERLVVVITATPSKPRQSDGRHHSTAAVIAGPPRHNRNSHRHESHRYDYTTKTLITATIVAAVGKGIYEARQSFYFANQSSNISTTTSRSPTIHQLQRERDEPRSVGDC